MKKAQTDHPVHEFIASRWSPYGFTDREIAEADLLALFEAARWAPSCFNEQPWRFVVATRGESAAFDRALSCLVDANQAWAKSASALVLAIASLTFDKNGKPNAAAKHDLGLAAANLSLEATSRGLHVHQMLGIHSDRVRELYGVPEGYEPLTAIAVGYAADPATLEDKFRERDTTARSRRPLAEFVFAEGWGQAAFGSEPT